MKMTFEYGKQTFTADLSDSKKNARLALQLAWKLIDEDYGMTFYPYPDKIYKGLKRK